MAHTHSLPLTPPGQKDVTSAQACCHQRLAEQIVLLFPALGAPGRVPLFAVYTHPFQDPLLPPALWPGPFSAFFGGTSGFLEQQSVTSSSRGAESWAGAWGHCWAWAHCCPTGHLACPALHTLKPPGLPSEQIAAAPKGIFNSFCRVYSHSFSSVQICFSSAWQECFCFYFPPLLPLPRQ